MKFINFTREQNIFNQLLYIDVKEPFEYPGIVYYYPDGITKGLFFKRTYIASGNFGLGCQNLFKWYKTLDEIIREHNTENLFIDDGKVYNYGSVIFKYKDIEDNIVFNYKNNNELKTYLENLSDRNNFYLHDFVSLENKNQISLYEYKENLS